MGDNIKRKVTGKRGEYLIEWYQVCFSYADFNLYKYKKFLKFFKIKKLVYESDLTLGWCKIIELYNLNGPQLDDFSKKYIYEFYEKNLPRKKNIG